MKTITLPDDMVNELMKLAKEYTSQKTRWQAMPVYFTIQTQEEVPAYDDCGEYGHWVHHSEPIADDIDELFAWAEDYFEKCESEEWKNMNEPDRISWLSNNGCKYYEYDLQAIEKNCFFTAKGCEEHIKRNSYHYREPRSYANTFFRNPEMELIASMLIELSKQQTH